MQVEEDPSPFFEPLLRSFLLGLGAGALFESLHVCLKVRARRHHTLKRATLGR